MECQTQSPSPAYRNAVAVETGFSDQSHLTRALMTQIGQDSGAPQVVRTVPEPRRTALQDRVNGRSWRTIS